MVKKCDLIRHSGKKYNFALAFYHLNIFIDIYLQMNVLCVHITVMAMPPVTIHLAASHAPAILDLREMELIAWVCIELSF